MTRANLIPLAAMLTLVTACTDGDGASPIGGAAGRATAANVPVAKVTGPPQSCIPINQFRETRIRDDSTIDFIGNGRDQAWRVSLASPCPGLKAENKFSYETSLTQLCSADIIYVLYNYGGTLQRGPGCGLAPFVPVDLNHSSG